MKLNKLQMLLFVIVVFICLNRDYIIENFTVKYGLSLSTVGGSTTSYSIGSGGSAVPLSNVTSDCARQTGVSSPQCIASSESCRNKTPGENCRVSGQGFGTCTQINNSLTCNLSSSSIATAIDTQVRMSQPIPITSANRQNNNYYVIRKDRETKTHSPMCTETTSTALQPSCDSLMSPSGNITCSSTYSNCCLCDTNKWDKVYTSKSNDNLQGQVRGFAGLSIFPNILTSEKSSYKIVKIKKPNLGNITAKGGNGDNFHRFFKMKDRLNIKGKNVTNPSVSDASYYTPSKGYFFKGLNSSTSSTSSTSPQPAQETYPLTNLPGYFRSSATSQIKDSFFYENCLYQSDSNNNCICPSNTTKKAGEPTSNPLCQQCPTGSTTIGNSPICHPCKDNNKVVNTSGNCDTCGVNDIYREQGNIGLCKTVNNVITERLIRNDCVSKVDAPPRTDCTIPAPSPAPAPYYVVNNPNNISEIQNYYNMCNSISSSAGNNQCEVIQSIIGGTTAVEGYKNYNDSRYSTYNTSNIGQNSEYNMVTNELCKEITEPDKCHQLKQCKWHSNTNKCLVDVKHNKYTHNDIDHYFIPVPTHTFTHSNYSRCNGFTDGVSCNRNLYCHWNTPSSPGQPGACVSASSGRSINRLSTECNGRIFNDCVTNAGCHWNSSGSGTCEDLCTTKTRENDCISDTHCQWQSNTCSRKNILSCSRPIDSTTTQRYIHSTLPLSPSELNYNNLTKCKGLTDYSTNNGSNTEYIGDVKGFCFRNDNNIKSTGCIGSHKINNLTMHKNSATITSNVSKALANELPSHSLLESSGKLLPHHGNLLTSPTTPPVTDNCLKYESCEGSLRPFTGSYTSLTQTDVSNPHFSPITNTQHLAADLINNCRELCIENLNQCSDYGVKFPTSFATNTDEGCYLLKNKTSGSQTNLVEFEVRFEPAIEVHYGVKYYPCTIRLKDPGRHNIQNVVGIVGLDSARPLHIPYFYRLYNPITNTGNHNTFCSNKTTSTDCKPDYNCYWDPGSSTCGDRCRTHNDSTSCNGDIMCQYSAPNCSLKNKIFVKPLSDFHITIPGIPNTSILKMYKISDNTTPSSVIDTIDIHKPKCKPKPSTSLNQITYSNCYQYDTNVRGFVDLINPTLANNTRDHELLTWVHAPLPIGTNSVAAAALRWAARVSSFAADNNCASSSNCQVPTYTPTNPTNPMNVPVGKQFMLGTGNEDTFIYKDGTFQTFDQICVKITGTNSNIWGGNTAETLTPASSTPFHKNNILIKPQKIQIDRGGILKLNHGQPTAPYIDIMKLYLLEGAPELRFNLVGKRTAAGADWCIPNIHLKLKDPPQSFSIKFPMVDASSV